MIEKLNVKYKNDLLTVEELNRLKMELQQCTDADLAVAMEDLWMNNQYDLSCVDEKRLLKIKQNLDSKIGFTQSGTTASQPNEKKINWLKWTQLAATIMLPIFMVLTYFFYHENKMLVSENIQITTAVGEKATVNLPDGTVVTMNSSSSLSYQPGGFNTKDRNVNFKGEAFFQVKKSHSPFRIYAKGLVVEVLGTKFNLDAREEKSTAALALESGKVKFLAVNTGESVVIHPNQQIVFNRLNGQIKVYKVDDIGRYSSWRKQEMVFRNANFANLLKTIEKTYNVTIVMDNNSNFAFTDLFNGTLSSSNLNEVMDVIEKIYHLHSEIVGDTVYLSRN